MVSRKDIQDAGNRMSQVYLKQGAIAARHLHEHPQWIYVLQGAISLRLPDSTLTVREGEIVRIPAQVPHQAEALDDSFVLSVE